MAETRQVEAPDGRTLRVEAAGDGERVVVVQLGTPNGGVLYEPWVDDAASRGLTLVTYDRPGYGGSSRRPGRSVADCAGDVRAIGRSMGFERCAVWGFSGGGPHALACAALLPDLVEAVAVIGSPAPRGARARPSRRDDGREPRGYRALPLRPGAVGAPRPQRPRGHAGDERRRPRGGLVRGRLARRRRAASHRFRRLAAPGGRGRPRAERRRLAGRRGRVQHRAGDSTRPGSRFPSRCGTALDDRFVPIQQGRWLAETIPGAEAEIRDGDGHLRVAATRIGDVHEWLASPRATRRPSPRTPGQNRRDRRTAARVSLPSHCSSGPESDPTGGPVMSTGYTLARVDQIEEITDGRCPWRPVRHHFGITSFGVNLWTGKEPGDRIINEHDEADENEELYLVHRGPGAVRVRRRDGGRPRGHVRLREAGREADGVRRGGRDDDPGARRNARTGVRARRLGAVGADRAALPGGQVRGGGRHGARPRRGPSRVPGAALQPRLLREPGRPQGRRRQASAIGDRALRPAAPARRRRTTDIAAIRDDPSIKELLG